MSKTNTRVIKGVNFDGLQLEILLEVCSDDTDEVDFGEDYSCYATQNGQRVELFDMTDSNIPDSMVETPFTLYDVDSLIHCETEDLTNYNLILYANRNQWEQLLGGDHE